VSKLGRWRFIKLYPRMIAGIRYLDAFTKIDSRWYFAERKLLVDWIDSAAICLFSTVDDRNAVLGIG
jgi:hypothetical protein